MDFISSQLNKITIRKMYSYCCCLWHRYARDRKLDINFKYFWKKVSYDQCGTREPRKSFAQHIQNTYNARSFILNADENHYIFTIGIDLLKEFEVAVRLENENSGDYVELNTSEVEQLFNTLHQNLLMNIKFPTTEKESTSKQINTVSVKLDRYNTYKLCVNGKKLFITLKGILKLVEVELSIKMLLDYYKLRSIQVGNTVFKLLKVCCEELQKRSEDRKYGGCGSVNENYIFDPYDAFILRENISDSQKDFDTSVVLDDLIRSPCDCLSTSFIIEMRIQFEKLISRWTAAYYETRLLSEAIRFETFKRKNWPHKFINISTLAKNGFFYVGPYDTVQCVFCKLILKDWKQHEIVETEHKKYSAYCPLFLNEFQDNIPLDSYSELEKIL